MGSTPLGFPYPDGSSAPNGPGGISGLATAIDSYLGGSTGWVACPAASGYSSTLVAYKFGPLVVLAGAITKSSGNFGGSNITVANLPDTSWAALTSDPVNVDLYGYATTTGSAKCEVTIAPGTTAITATYEGSGTFSILNFNGVVYAHV